MAEKVQFACCGGSSSPVYTPLRSRQGVWDEMKRRFTLFSTCSPPSSPRTPASLHVAPNARETTREPWMSRKILVWLFASGYALPILFFWGFFSFYVLSLSSWWLRVTCKSHLQVNSSSRCPFAHFWDVFFCFLQSRPSSQSYSNREWTTEDRQKWRGRKKNLSLLLTSIMKNQTYHVWIDSSVTTVNGGWL